MMRIQLKSLKLKPNSGVDVHGYEHRMSGQVKNAAVQLCEGCIRVKLPTEHHILIIYYELKVSLYGCRVSSFQIVSNLVD